MGVIQLPGLFDQIQPGLQGIGNFISDLVNPDAQRQMAVRNAILAGRIDPQALNNMGAAQVEQTFGKGTGGFATGPESPQHKLQGVANEEIQRILTSGTPQEKEELVGKLTGVQTTTERQAQQDRATYEAGQAKKITDENQGRAEGESAGRIVQARLGPKFDLYKAAKGGQISQDELTKMLAVPEYKSQYENGQQDFWRQQQLALNYAELQERQRARLEGRDSPQAFMQKRQMMNAAEIADKYNVNADAAYAVMKGDLVNKYTSMKPSDVPVSEQPLYAAAMAIKKNADNNVGQNYLKQIGEFRRQTAGLDAKLSTTSKSTPAEKQAALVEKNTLAKQIFGAAAPQWKYDTKAPNNDSGTFGFGKDNTLYRVGGNTMYWGSDEPSVSAAADSKIPDLDPKVDEVAHQIVAGKINPNEAIATAPNPQVRDMLQKRVAELQQSQVADNISTGGEAKVKSALTIPQDTLNLNVGTSVKPTASAPDTTGKGIADSVINKGAKFLTDSISAVVEKPTPVREAAAKAAVNTLTDQQVMSIINSFKRAGNIPSDGPSVSAQKDVTVKPKIDVQALKERGSKALQSASNAQQQAADYYSEDNFLKTMNTPMQFTLLKTLRDTGKIDKQTFDAIVSKSEFKYLAR